MKKKLKKKNKLFGAIAVFAFVIGAFFAIFGLAHTIVNIDQVAISHAPSAILASAGVTEEKGVFLPVMYFDQRADECVNIYDNSLKEQLMERQFEWSSCGYYGKKVEQGLVSYELGDGYLPTWNSGQLIPNRGQKDMTRWFSKVEGKSMNFLGNMKMDYKANKAEFSFYQREFYPLDEVEFSKGDYVNTNGHNHLFTMNFAVPFTPLLTGGEAFSITADDDTFVYLGDKLVIDMGGIHGAETGRFMITADGEVYNAVGNEEFAYSGINVEKDTGSVVRIFHADRDSAESVFGITFTGMSLSLTDSKLASRGDTGIQVAYDPTDPSYVAPLGESKVVRPDGTRGYIIMATIMGVLVVTTSLLIAISTRFVLKKRMN